MSQDKAKTTKPAATRATVAAPKPAQKQAATARHALVANSAGTEAARVIAETAMTQSREAYERAKDAMEGTVEMLEASLDKAGTGVTEMNRKVIDITQANLNAGFELARSLAEAKDMTQVIEIQSAYARRQFELLALQAEEVRDLAAKVSNETVEPFKSHFSRTIKAFETAH